jgi:Holliday junction DNA helicase RuvB
VGQESLIHNLSVFIQAAKGRAEAMDHILFHGPPGLGKTTLAHLVAHELGVRIAMTSGPVLMKPGDLAAILTNLGPLDILFIDEIHRLPVSVEEMLYSAMEDRRIDIMIGEGPHAKSIQLPLAPFTLVGATTRSGLLSAPLRDRFGILLGLSFYHPKELEKILERAAQKMQIAMTQDAQAYIADRCRGTPRIALRLLRRIRDFADVQRINPIHRELVASALSALNINAHGLDGLDQRYLSALAHHFQGGPVGIETMAAILCETRDTVEDVVEPYLLRQGFVQRTARGRVLTDAGWQSVGL